MRNFVVFPGLEKQEHFLHELFKPKSLKDLRRLAKKMEEDENEANLMVRVVKV